MQWLHFSPSPTTVQFVWLLELIRRPGRSSLAVWLGSCVAVWMETVLEAECLEDPDHVYENRRLAGGERHWENHVLLWEECISVEGGNTGKEKGATQAPS